jgi:long-chain acyl-CoA synthetase
VAYPSAAEIAERVAGQTLASSFLETAAEHGDRAAVRWRVGDTFESRSWADLRDLVARVAGGLRAIGVRPDERVVLMLRNTPEFHVVDLACVFLGATPISIYNSSSDDQVAYLAGHSRATVAFVEDDEFLARFVAVRDQLPELRTIVTMQPPASDDAATSAGADLSYATLLEADPIDLAAAAASVSPDQLATVIYTSGTTGPPKGVMLTHAQVRYTVESLAIALGFPREELAGKRLVSYLPMAHIAERMTSYYSGVYGGYEVTTCPDVSQIGAYLRDVRPHIAFGVPRVWEKIQAGVMAALAADAEKLRSFEDAVAAAEPIALARAAGTMTAEQEATWAFLDEVAFAPIRALLGLDALDIAVSGAAPIPAELLLWFRSVGVPLTEIYGMSESGGPMLWEPWKVKAGTVGFPIPGCEVRLEPDGEIVCRGGNVFSGYLDDPERTAEALDADGWLHSGDIGAIDEDGYWRVIDRKKELIITAGGKNVSPANLEAKLKLVPLVGQACAIGDNRPFVSALLVLDPETAAAFARREGIEYSTLAELAKNPRVLEVVGNGVEQAMASFNRAERVRRFVLLGDEWMADSEELTPTSKLKRRNVHAKFAAEIESMYAV